MPQILGPGPAQQIVAKAMQIRFGLKTDQIVSAQRFDQVAMVRQHAQQFGGRKRGMQEKADGLAVVQAAQFAAERDQVIVVDPDQVLAGQHRRQRTGKASIYPQIAGKITPRIFDQRAAKVEQRPQHAIGKAKVVFLKIAARQIEGGVSERAARDQFGFAARLRR